MTPVHDPDGKVSIARTVILMSVIACIAGAALHNEDLTEVGKYLLTSFLGWEARKHHADPTK